MTEGMGLPEGELRLTVSGFRWPEVGRAGVKVVLHLPAAAVAQLTRTGATGGVAGENLRVELRNLGLGDGDGPLDVVEVLVEGPGPGA
jgi:hypothetical protein